MILDLDDPAARDAAASGGKGASLARLRAAGFPVPAGFVVAATALAGRAERLGLDPTTVPAAAEAARRELLDTPLEADLGAALATALDRLGAGTLVAVRSSGLSEDGAGASFAGQHETVLGVRGAEAVAAALRRCHASFLGQRALAYRRELSLGGWGGAVVVQVLVPARAAGVGWSVDPLTGDASRISIDAALGLGETVVSGRVTPDSFVLDKGSAAVLERRLGPKSRRLRATTEGTLDEGVTDDEAARPALDDEALAAVGNLVRDVEAHEGRPVDVEWAWDGARAHLLQARAVTATAGPADDWRPELNTRVDPRFPLYTRGNIGEILPGCVRPLTWSLFSHGLERAFRDLTERVGSMPPLGPEPVVVGYFFHRVYLNASYFMAAADRSPGASRDTVYEDLIGPPPRRHPAWRWSDLLPWRLPRAAGILWRYLSLQKRVPEDVAALRSHFGRAREALAARPLSAVPMAELLAALAPGEEGLLPVRVHVRVSQFAVSSYTTLRQLAGRWLGDEALAARLTTGLGALVGADPAAGVDALARAVAADPALRALFAADDEAVAAQLPARLPAFAGFLERFGHRGYREADPGQPTWREAPAQVVALVRARLTSAGLDPEAVAARQREQARFAREQALARLSGWRRGFFAALVNQARAHLAAREETKDLLLRCLDLQRQLLGGLFDRLASPAIPRDDLHFLLLPELAALTEGGLTVEDARARVGRRRREFRWSQSIVVPKLQDGAARFLRAASEAEPGDLRGLGVSAGVAEGRVRVVLDPRSARLEAGEVLVAPVTDVAWTPLFYGAAALVVEVGGPLSHGAIVARELGLPAVVAVAGATTRLRDGERVRVDGARGAVTVLP